MTKQIPLTQGKVAIVDDDMYEYLMQWKWSAIKSRSTYYAKRNGGFPFRKMILMHRVIMNTPDGMETDHRDHDGLNNTRANLRNCTRSQNLRNHKTRNSSGFKGIKMHQGKWRADIYVDGKRIYLGSSSNAEDAAKLYDEAAKKYFGEFANLNFPGAK